ncbi:MAG: dihydroorotase family protein [Hadesarchaea archaeon]|nr:dihydroorotase family protein [Hadesarchaea archaeon]
MPDLVIRNTRLVLPEGIVRGELSIEEGRISEIAVSGLAKGDREIDAKDNIVMPGAIDVHVHFYDRKFLHREDFRSGSIAAAAGGVTSVVVMPLDTPTFTPRTIKDVIRVGQKDSLIDFALHAGNMMADSIKYVSEVAALGIKSFKVFTCAPYYMDYKAIGELMGVVKSVDGVTFVHAEDDEVLRDQTQRVLHEGRKDPFAHSDARPSEAEEKAVQKILPLSRRTGCRLHLAHITTRKGCELLREAKKKRLPVTAETCPHYLIFTREDITRLGPFLKVSPGLKTSEDCAALWDALAEGVIDIVATDHAPGTRKEKEVGWKDIWKAQIGVPGVETLLPIMLTEGVAKGRLMLERMVDILCAKPAQIFDLYPRKGVIREGSDADLVVIDLKKKTTIMARELHHKIDWTPYEGMRVKGMPTMTISRGIVLAEDGEVVGEPTHGQFLAR